MAVNKERVRLGVAALRSGEFEQGAGYLKYNGKYCCLGVFCEIAIRNGCEVQVLESDAQEGKFFFDGIADFLPRSVMEWYGFDSHNPKVSIDPELHSCADGCCPMNGASATEANDELHWDFSQIADGFEEMHLKGEPDA